MKFEENRTSTDIAFLLLYAGYWAGLVVVAAIAFANGDPDRILYGTDYLGFVCGKGPGPANFSVHVANSVHQSPVWGENTNLWVSIAVPTTVFGTTTKSPLAYATEALKLAVCVKTCPTPVTTFSLDLFTNPTQLPDKFRVMTYGSMRYAAVKEGGVYPRHYNPNRFAKFLLILPAHRKKKPTLTPTAKCGSIQRWGRTSRDCVGPAWTTKISARR